MFTFQDEPENYTTNPDTVVYMPHCDLSLFERFLKDNWFPERIPNIILVGNTLSDYADKCVFFASTDAANSHETVCRPTGCQQFILVYRSWVISFRYLRLCETDRRFSALSGESADTKVGFTLLGV